MASNYNQISSTSTVQKSVKFIQIKEIAINGPKIFGHISCVVNNFMYVHGGLINKNDKIPSNQLFRFDFNSGWKDITPLNCPNLSHHAVVVQDEYIILIGGWNGNSRISDVYIFNTNNNEMRLAESRNFPTGAGLSNHTCTLLKDGRIIIFGREGSLKTQRKYGNSFILEGNPKTEKYIYHDLEINTASRSGHSNIEIDKNHLMIIGGRKDKIIEIHSFPLNYLNNNNNESSSLGTIIETNINLNNCKILKKDPGGRRGSACIKINKSLCLIHGGETFESHFRNPVDDILILNFQTFKWFSAGETGLQLQNHTICNLDGRYIIHGGLTTNNQTNNITFELC